MKHISAILIALALVVGLALPFTGPQPAQAQDDLRIVVIGKSVAPYWSNVETGTQAAARDLGLGEDQVIFFVPPREDVAAQIQAMETYIAQGVTGIAIAPSDPNALEPVMQRAAEAGIFVTTLDTPPVENSASLVVERVTWSHTFWTTGTKPVQYTAGPGMSYLQVALRAAHLGHKGDGVNTRIQIPAESTFTLHYAGETYRPLASPGPTTQGGSYTRVLLGRGEFLTGYLFFEVPEGLDPASAYLQTTIVGESPVWRLGGTP